MNIDNLIERYGSNTFNDNVMRERLPKTTYNEFHSSLRKGEALSKECAAVIANAMKIWALEKGATHFTHWFSPLTGLSCEKHDAFLEPEGSKMCLEFSGKLLRKGESDASSFPSGGLRATFEARGYTAWDCTSPAFVKDGSLYIPTLFCSYTGEALDNKTPLLKSCEALKREALQLLPLLGIQNVNDIVSNVGSEQEYFLISEECYKKRLDLKFTGRTLFGAKPPKGQEMDDHYFGIINPKVSSFMKELDQELWNYGIPSKTKHNEAAPSQHEIACVFRNVNITNDNNNLLMQLMKEIAQKHGLRCLLHEKPFKGVNGSGKHNNWSVLVNNEINLFSPGKDPLNNIPFLASLACVIKGVDEYSDLLRLSIATPGNDHRLGGNEAPPAIISIFLGDQINEVINSLMEDREFVESRNVRFQTGVSVIPDFSKDNTDRNRTSPFAFTGNKFEFRGVGSSQSISSVNTMLNAILAIEMKQMAEEIKKGKSPKDVIKDFIMNHKRIIFEGDGYSPSWEKEAKERGLSNKKDTVTAIECLKNPKLTNMLIELGIHSKIEFDSRYEILLENYSKTIRVEGLTSLRMAQNEIYPVAVQYLHKLATTCNEMKSLGVDVDYLMDDLNELSVLTRNMKFAMKELENNIHEFECNEGSVLEKAIFARDKMASSMEKLREIVDTIETKIDANIWPIPTYIDLLFGI